MEVTLRNYQEEGVTKLREQFARGARRVLFVLPTGGGKTVVFTHIAERAASKGNRICVIVHRQELVDQASRSLAAIGVKHGIIAAGYKMDSNHDVVVASVQTLVRRLRLLGPDYFQLLIVDEAHHAVAGTWSKVIDYFEKAKVLGVTATPERLDGRGLGEYFDAMVEGPAAAALTEDGYLAPARVYAPPTELDLSSLHTRMGDYAMDEASEAMQRPQIMGDIVQHFRLHIQHGTAIAFCCSIEHAKAVADAFNAEGIPAAMIDGKLDKVARRELIEQLGQGDIRLLSSCNLISEGTDVPSVTGALLLRPTQSLSLYLQQVGRCLRPAEGKQHAVILDHVGNVHKHGLPVDAREWSLNGVARRHRDKVVAPPVKVCKVCFSAVPSGVQECPECATPFVSERRLLRQVDGELQEILNGHKKEKRREVGKARSLEQLKQLAKERGYSPGWAHHVYSARQRRPNAGA